MHSSGFAPVADANARFLVLGTLPWQMSLRMQQYYAQPRNAFWKIMGEIFGAGPEMPYEGRLQRLKENGIALWDVCAAAHRPGSLDASIDLASVEANPFGEFFAEHSAIKLVCFNGAKAHALYQRLVVPDLKHDDIRYAALPSTSPAHAGMPYAEKLARWSSLLR